MKILFITQNIAPFRINWINELAKYAEIEVFHLNEYDKTCNPKFLESIRANVIVRDISTVILRKRLFKIKEIERAEYDVLMLDGYGFTAQVILIMHLIRRKRPFLLSIDGSVMPDHEGLIKHLVKKTCISSASAYFSTSESTDRYIRYYSTDNKPIYRHLFSSLYSKDIISFEERKQNHDAFKEQLNLQGKTVILCVGRFVQFKRYDIIINAAKLVDDNYTFVFVGGKMPNEYEKYINQSNKSKIVFIDYLYPDELKRYYIAADVFCHPAQGEVWGLVVGEAMAMGLPVIASDTCNAALAMIDKDGGCLVHGDDPADYAKAIINITKDPAAMELMQKRNINTVFQYAIDNAAKHDINNIKDYYKLTNSDQR